VSESFHHNEEMLHTVVKGIVVTAAMEMLGFFDQDQLFAQDTDPQEALHDVAHALAGFFSFRTPPNCIQEAIDACVDNWQEPYGCICGEVDGKLTCSLINNPGVEITSYPLTRGNQSSLG
jgi:hypothetical protein